MASKEMKETMGEKRILNQKIDCAEERFVTPAVDVFETAEGLTLIADMPGVANENLEVGIENDLLTIEGRNHTRNGERVFLREFASAHYYRKFQLPDKLDYEKVSAELKNGVLILKFPKVAVARPRRIEVSSIH